MLAIGMLILVGCAKSYPFTKAELRPDLTSDDSEIWHIKAWGYNDGFNGLTESWILENAMAKAAYSSKKENKDCFVILDKNTQGISHSFTTTGTQTMYGKSNSQGSAGYSTDYYNNSGKYLGNSQGNIYSQSNTNYSYQVPVQNTYTWNGSDINMYVSFLNEDTCNALSNSKWRNNIRYNDKIIDDYENKAKENEKIKMAGNIVGGISLAVMVVVTIVILNSIDNSDSY
jgi:hypothetical protein